MTPDDYFNKVIISVRGLNEFFQKVDILLNLLLLYFQPFSQVRDIRRQNFFMYPVVDFFDVLLPQLSDFHHFFNFLVILVNFGLTLFKKLVEFGLYIEKLFFTTGNIYHHIFANIQFANISSHLLLQVFDTG